MESFLAAVFGFGGNFAPRGWALCHGQLLPINQNQSLFSLLGTTYGGDGRTTFALPDLRGRAMIGPGHGPGLSNRTLGAKGGAETVALDVTQIPPHSHIAVLHGETGNATQNDPEGHMLGNSAPRTNKGFALPNANPNVNMSSESIAMSNNGGGQAHENMSPWLASNYIIALTGVFPSRS